MYNRKPRQASGALYLPGRITCGCECGTKSTSAGPLILRKENPVQLLLERFAYTDVGTFGRLYLGGLTLFTCEDPWRENATGKSCIPEGLYTIGPDRYHKHAYDCYGVRDVPGRSRILIHKGNSDEDTEGCILVGNLWPGWIGGKGLSVGDSAGAFASFMAAMGGQTLQMEIKQYQPNNMDRYRKAA